MERRLSLVAPGVADLIRSRRFYEKGPGWRTSKARTGEVASFEPSGIALAQHVRAREEIDAVLADGLWADGRQSGEVVRC